MPATETKPTGSSTQKILRFCEEIERLCADIYTAYAERFSDDPELKRLWNKIADEELNHARIISLAMRCKGLELRDRQYDMESFRAQVRTVHDLMAGMKATATDSISALQAAIILEKQLADFHLEKVVDFVDPSNAKFFKVLFDADHQHIRQLEEAYEQRC